MTDKLEQLPVIFRTDEKVIPGFAQEVTAVFPTLPGTNDPQTMTCYAHVGQHGTCSLDWYDSTRPANREEYGPLLAELRGIYETRPASNPEIYGPPVKLRVCKRISAKMNAERRAA